MLDNYLLTLYSTVADVISTDHVLTDINYMLYSNTGSV